ncbi:hypothetical protein [Ruminiclostridium papyrosolvens]|uniref:Uncharacterized protein n=1 Tax=Ruminiclostridium papyrosolvens C7 TaxID=1330534 RepID=U4R5N3_9FIRM|nr:hypothetical protein [Ruminiclostridium papyrosolvens]EPR13898.1 hypothetical protein L323_02140 [Ruminiclostridium papyrosolvens C7]
MKKKSILSLVLVLAISFSSFTCFAQGEKKEKIILEKNNEITDINVLIKRAEDGIDESRGKSRKCLKDMSKAIIKNKDTKEEVEVETKTTTQLLESSIENNIITNSFATTAILSREDSGSSTGADVGATSTIYWSEYTISSGGQQVPVVQLTRATGRWFIYQSGVVLSNLLTQGCQQGWRDPSGQVVDNAYWAVTSYTGYDMRYYFTPIEQDSLWCLLSERMTCDWKRGTGSTYTFEFVNCQSF